MPKRDDITSVLVIGSGPIVIGQACEFDYSGTQACRVLQAEGIRVSLVNSNPATIMTDPEFADRTYVEPVTADYVEQVIARERPDAVLPTMGGQTALNVAMALAERGVLEKYGCELIGANARAIKMAIVSSLARIGFSRTPWLQVGGRGGGLKARGRSGGRVSTGWGTDSPRAVSAAAAAS